MTNKKPLFTQPLNSEVIKEMKERNSKDTTLSITEIDKQNAICTHKDPDKNNEFSLIDEKDGSNTCYICGANFNLINCTDSEIDEVVNKVTDIIQTIKTIHLDMSEEDAEAYMDMLLSIKNLKHYYNKANSNFDKYDVSFSDRCGKDIPFNYGPVNNHNNPFNNHNNPFNNYNNPFNNYNNPFGGNIPYPPIPGSTHNSK